MNVEIGTEAALFPEKEYINAIFVAVQPKHYLSMCLLEEGEGVYTVYPLYTIQLLVNI
jgi:hypothetical protein